MSNKRKWREIAEAGGTRIWEYALEGETSTDNEWYCTRCYDVGWAANTRCGSSAHPTLDAAKRKVEQAWRLACGFSTPDLGGVTDAELRAELDRREQAAFDTAREERKTLALEVGRLAAKQRGLGISLGSFLEDLLAHHPDVDTTRVDDYLFEVRT